MIAKTLKFIASTTIAAVGMLPAACNGIFDSVYDDPIPDEDKVTAAGQLYIDASNWSEWHYIDLHELARQSAEDPEFNPNTLWDSRAIPTTPIDESTRNGIYTYWYDVFGDGISSFEFQSFTPTKEQPAPDSWTFAIHRDNVRTNGCSVAQTTFTNIEELPEGTDFIATLEFHGDTWNETDVWVDQSHMLSGLIGNQGIEINTTLSGWLKVDIPPIPPAFTLNNRVFIIALPDGSYGALQLENYQSSTGTKCCLTINYRYPL